MSKTLLAGEPLIKKGLHVLMCSLGMDGASRFIMCLERGEGDSVIEFRKMWKGKSARTIHKSIVEAKQKGVI